MPEKVIISYRGAKYEIGRGKRYYGIWVAGAPQSDPIDRWPLTREGWTQAWARYSAMETPGTIAPVEKPRPGFKLPRAGGLSGKRTAQITDAVPRRKTPGRELIATGLLGLGVLLGLIGLFPAYVGTQSLASQSDQLVPHLMYLVAWAVSAALIALGAARTRPGTTWQGTTWQGTVRQGTVRPGALLAIGLSAVTFGLFFSDVGQVISAPQGSSLLGAGLILSLLGWLACAAGSVLALIPRRRPAPASALSPTGPSPTSPSPADSPAAGQPPASPSPAGPSYAGPAGPAYAGAAPAGPYLAGPPFAGQHAGQSPAAARRGWLNRAGEGGPVKPRLAGVGPLVLVVLAAIGAVAAFAPSWDSYTLTQAASGTSQTITAGNAFSNPGVMIAGDVAVMIAVVAVAVFAALWRPVRHGAVLLVGVIVALAAQAISALIQVSEPVTPAQFGISQGEASAAGLTISSGLTPIFWVYCVFVISLIVSCAWMLSSPPQYPAMQSAPLPPTPGPDHQSQGIVNQDDDDSGDSDDDAEDDAESSYA